MQKAVVIDAKFAKGKDLKIQDGVYYDGDLQKKIEDIGKLGKITNISKTDNNNQYVVIYETNET